MYFYETTVSFYTPSSSIDHSYVVDLFVKIVEWLTVYYSLLLIVAGCVCNPLSFIVLSRKAFRHSPTSIYLRFLSAVDLGAILAGFTRFFAKRAYDLDVREYNSLSCKINVFFSALFLYLSSWTLVAVTTERMMSIAWPHRVHLWCSKMTASICVLVILFGHSLICIAYAVSVGVGATFDPFTNATISLKCVQNVEGRSNAISTFGAVHFAFLPCFIVIIFNIVIIHGVVKSRRRVLKAARGQGGNMEKTVKSGTDTDSSYHAENLTQVSECSETSQRTVAKASKTASAAQRRQNKDRKKSRISGGSRRETSLTITLLAVTFTFVVCNFPNAAYGQTRFYMTIGDAGVWGQALSDLLDIVMYTNNSLNFALYCITGSRFRNEVKAVFTDILRCQCGLKL